MSSSWLHRLLPLALGILLAACNSMVAITGPGFVMVFSSSSVLCSQDGTPAPLTVTVSGTSNATTLSVGQLPAGVTSVVTQPSSGGSGTVTFTASPQAAPGTYTVNINGQSGSAISSKQVTLVIVVSAVVSSATDTSLGINGQWKQFMSTSFQPAEWSYQYFQAHPTFEPAQLNQLAPQHIRLQGISQAVPWKANSNPKLPTDWDFTMLDAIVQPVLGAADHSPEFQIATAPPFSGLVDSSGHLIVNSANLQLMASYFANLVRYYNKGGFDWGGKHFQSASSQPIVWWGIFNEYNINGLTPAEYVQLYNTVVPAMLAVDPTLKFSAVELSDFDYQTGDPRNNLPTFVAAPSAGGVNAQVDIVSTHFYSSCNQTDTDTQLFASIPVFVSDVQYFRQQLASRPDLANTPVWVTENNVNADYSNNGKSNCNPSQVFVPDARGTSGFFAAWRPYVYSQLGKAGSQALYHWDYSADSQYGEVSYGGGGKYLSYWVDYTLGKLFPVTSSTSPSVLALQATDADTVETLAVRNPDGTVVVMVTNRAVHSASDNNGAGDPRTVIVDTTALGNFSSAQQYTLQRDTDLTNGPQPVSVSPNSKLSVTLPGYGTVILQLKP